jgi:Xaa-Pro aminopeptidase
MTITVEPGIYWKEKGVGVRIEDDIVITKNGAQIIGDNSISLL